MSSLNRNVEMKLGYLIYTKYESERNKFFIEKLFDSARKNSIKLELLISERLNIVLEKSQYKIYYNDTEITIPDFVIQRTMDYRLSRSFELMGCRVFNSSKVSFLADSKYNAYMEVSRLGINVLKTYMQNKNYENVLFFPNVTKPVDSKGADRVFYNKNIEEYKKNIITYGDRDFILQEPSKILGKDLRVYVIGKKIIASALRVSNHGFISNFCKNGNAEIYTLSSSERNIVEKIINAFDFDYVGIDFLFNNDGFVFNEIENVVGARMLYSLTDIDVADEFMEYIASCI